MPRGRARLSWPVRAALAALAGFVGYVSVTQSLAQAVARQNSSLAQRLAPSDGRILARRAIALSGVEATPADRRRADELAAQALTRDATAVTAVATLGLNAEVRRDRPRARRLFAYSQQLSRRSFETQLWAIEDAVLRNDIPGALRHYDIALRTTGRGANLLFPVLASAITDPAIRLALVRTMVAKPNWSENFVTYIASHQVDPRATADLFLQLQRSGMYVPESAQALTVNALVNAGAIDQGWRYYAATTPNVDRTKSRDPTFLVDQDTSALFDWVPIQEGGVTTSIQRRDDAGVFAFYAPASMGGPLLQQMQLLPPGTYQLTGRSSGIEQDSRALPYWVLTCREGERELGRVVVPNSDQGGGRFQGVFAVPSDCPVQYLRLIARASDAVAGLSGQIEYVQLAPLR